MKLISNGRTLRKQLLRLIDAYSCIAFAVAWASPNEVFEQLSANRSKIKQAVIGTHFYQTHPNTLDAFVASKEVKFVLQPSGVFHPKVYLFWNDTQWEALIGSANLTLGALTDNSELMVLISGTETSESSLDQQIRTEIDSYSRDASSATNETALAYRTLWNSKRHILRSLGDDYGKRKSRLAPTASSVKSKSWEQFVAAVKGDSLENLEYRCELLRLSGTAFREHPSFESMELTLRQTIAGVPTSAYKGIGLWFGSMKGAGYFKEAVKSNNPHLSAALGKIPLVGPVSRAQYEEYMGEFLKAFPTLKRPIATASRLLALKRPDCFVCLDSKNLPQLCKDFGIPHTGMDAERYWNEVVCRILDCPWWSAVRPKEKIDGEIWDGRAAMLDSFFYRE